MESALLSCLLNKLFKFWSSLQSKQLTNALSISVTSLTITYLFPNINLPNIAPELLKYKAVSFNHYVSK